MHIMSCPELYVVSVMSLPSSSSSAYVDALLIAAIHSALTSTVSATYNILPPPEKIKNPLEPFSCTSTNRFLPAVTDVLAGLSFRSVTFSPLDFRFRIASNLILELAEPPSSSLTSMSLGKSVRTSCRRLVEVGRRNEGIRLEAPVGVGRTVIGLLYTTFSLAKRTDAL